MLSLDDPSWQELAHAYGNAADIPALLGELYSKSSEETWGDIWSSLCHQYTVYTATFAAIPHILAAARNLPAGSRWNHLLFLGVVAAHEDDSKILPAFRDEYVAARLEAADLAIMELVAGPKTAEDATYLLCSLAGLSGCKQLSVALEGFTSNEFQLECPHCSVQLYIWPFDEGYRTFSEDPVGNPAAAYTPVIATNAQVEPLQPTKEDICDTNALIWIYNLAERAGFPQIGKRAIQLFGNGSCPKCSTKFSVLHELLTPSD